MGVNLPASTAHAAVDYQQLRFDYRRHADQDAAAPVRHPVVVVGAGPVGLALAIDLAQQRVPVVLLDNDHRLADRLARHLLRQAHAGDLRPARLRRAAWWPRACRGSAGRVFFRQAQVYEFDLLPEPGHQRPAFVNLQQYYVEGYLAERAAQLPLIDLRWDNRVAGVEQHGDHALLRIETPEGSYRLAAD